MSEEKVLELYLSWVNDFISEKAFMEYYNLTQSMCNYIIEEGRALNNR